jgi:hypothetical protein
VEKCGNNLWRVAENRALSIFVTEEKKMGNEWRKIT